MTTTLFADTTTEFAGALRHALPKSAAPRRETQRRIPSQSGGNLKPVDTIWYSQWTQMDLPGRELFANVAISNPLEDLQSAIDRAAWEVSVFGGTHEVIETTNDSLFDSFVVHLERLRNGWAGPQSIAPSKEIVRDISLAAVSMEKVLVAPDIEVDEDGTVVFEWKNGGRSFCLTFTGNGTVVGTISPWNAAEPPWRANVKDEIAIAEKLETESISAFIGR